MASIRRVCARSAPQARRIAGRRVQARVADKAVRKVVRPRAECGCAKVVRDSIVSHTWYRDRYRFGYN
jgi:hypothetical protein